MIGSPDNACHGLAKIKIATLWFYFAECWLSYGM